MGQVGRFHANSHDSQVAGLSKAQGPGQNSRRAICISPERCPGWREILAVYSESDRDTHSMVVGALAHSETFSHSSLRTTKSNVNSPATSYGLNIESTCISFPNSGASSSTISSLSSVPASEAFIPEGGETVRELKVVFDPLATSERVFKAMIGGVEREERETFTSLSEPIVYAPAERLVDAHPRPLIDGSSGEELFIPPEGDDSTFWRGMRATWGETDWLWSDGGV